MENNKFTPYPKIIPPEELDTDGMIFNARSWNFVWESVQRSFVLSVEAQLKSKLRLEKYVENGKIVRYVNVEE